MTIETIRRNVAIKVGSNGSSRFPVAFHIVSVNPVKPVMTIEENIGGVTYRRPVRFSVFRHAAKVHGVTFTKSNIR